MHRSLSVSKAIQSPRSHDFHTLDIYAIGNFRDATRCDKKHTCRTNSLTCIASSMRKIKKMLPTSDYEDVPNRTALGKTQKIC